MKAIKLQANHGKHSKPCQVFPFFFKLQRHKCWKYFSYCVLSEVLIFQPSERSPCSHWNTWNNLWEISGIAHANNMYVLQKVILSASLITQCWGPIWMRLAVIWVCSEAQYSSAVGYLTSRFVNYGLKPQMWFREYVGRGLTTGCSKPRKHWRKSPVQGYQDLQE